MKIQFHRIDTNVVVGLLVREFCCSGTDVSAKVLAMYAGTRTPSMEPQWLASGLSQCQWWCNSMDASGFWSWQYHWTDFGEQLNAIDSYCIFNCTSCARICWKLNRCDDNGIRYYGINAGCDGNKHAVSCSDVLRNLRRRDSAKPCKRCWFLAGRNIFAH